jgi:large subunit ribosomal protein L12
MEVNKMEYIYAAMLIHKAGGKVDEATVKKVLEAAGVKVNDARVKALIASLEGVNIDEAIKNAAVQVAAPVAVAPVGESKKEEKKVVEDKKSEEQAAAGLGALFG